MNDLMRVLAERSGYLINPIFLNASRENNCLLYTSDAADDLLCVDLGGRRIIKKKNTNLFAKLIVLTYIYPSSSPY